VKSAAGAFYGGPVARAERKKGAGGSGVRHHVKGKTGKRERVLGAVGDSSGGCISPRPAGGVVAAR
jgi:hypothetical protein